MQCFTLRYFPPIYTQSQNSRRFQVWLLLVSRYRNFCICSSVFQSGWEFRAFLWRSRYFHSRNLPTVSSNYKNVNTRSDSFCTGTILHIFRCINLWFKTPVFNIQISEWEINFNLPSERTCDLILGLKVWKWTDIWDAMTTS